jgi:pilus assembly protein Flp/PilA
MMREVARLIKQLKQDENGASLIEYTVLLAILLIAVIAIIGGVGQWILGVWTNLNGNLP